MLGKWLAGVLGGKGAASSRAVAVSGPRLAIVRTKYYQREVVGESFHQDALIAVCGPYTRDGRQVELEAELVPEPDNPHDPNAFRVEIAGQTVGHLARQDAERLHASLRKLGHAAQPLAVDAQVWGGWLSRKPHEGLYGVKLAFPWPLRVQEI